VNCAEFQEHVTPAVDARLDASVMALFIEHVAQCPSCRQAFERERAVAALVRSRLHPAAVPAHVVDAILKAIAHEADARAGARGSRAGLRWNAVLGRVAVAFALSFAVVVVLVWRHGAGLPPLPPADSTGSDIVHQSMHAYQSALKGDLAPQISSEVADCVRSYFNGKTEFPVLVPELKECTLVGGGVNDYHGATFAHIVYKHGQQVISVYQACRETVMKGEKLHLSPEAREELARTGWYCCTTADGASIVVWVNGATICAAVAPMDRDHLMAHFVDANAGDTGAW
jgi:anti-sigma factor RsiW